MSKKISLGAAIAFMAIVAALTFSLTTVFSMNNFTDMVYNVRERESMYQKLAEIDRAVREKYPDPVDETKLMDSVAGGYVGGLSDSYGKYYTAAEYNLHLQSQEGKYVGIGVVPQIDPSGYLYIKEVYPESPAYNAQIMAGDLIIKIDEADLTPENSQDMMSMLRGDAGTKVALVIRRGTEDIGMEITRRQVEVPTVYGQNFDGIGHLRIKNFTDATRDQFNKQLNKLLSEGVGAVAIDLRDNSGGSTRAMSAVLDLLVGSGDIVHAKYKGGRIEVLASSGESQINIPMVVLTNEKTQNTAEHFAQVLKEFGKAKTVGAKTAGQGTVQEFIKLSDGSAINITVARYISPNGFVFDKEGVKPDYDVKNASEDIYWEQLDPELDAQLKKALELAQAGIKVEIAENASSQPQQ